MIHIKNISRDTGIEIDGQDLKIESEVFNQLRNNVNRMIYVGMQDLETGNFSSITITSKITLGFEEHIEGYDDDHREYAQLLGSHEEKLTRKKEEKLKEELHMGDYEIVSTDDGFQLIEKNGLQAKMDLEGIEDKKEQ